MGKNLTQENLQRLRGRLSSWKSALPVLSQGPLRNGTSPLSRWGFEKLTPRERRVIFIGSIFVVVLFILQLLVVPFFEARKNLVLAIERKQQELIQIKGLQKEFQALKRTEKQLQEKLAARAPRFSLFAFVERQAEQANVKKQISYIKPATVAKEQTLHEVSVEMKLQQITLDSLVHFLRLIESDEDVVFIRRIAIQENGNGLGFLDIILQIGSFEKKA
jgi:type II secretory pathway component PulM